MTLEIRPTDDPERFDLYEGEDRIGEIYKEPLDEEGITLGETPPWDVVMWSAMGTGKEWHGDSEDFDEIKQYAHEIYAEFVAERRELSKGSRIWTTGSVPMGGKPGWRRR